MDFFKQSSQHETTEFEIAGISPVIPLRLLR